jgi:oligo-1,6-glucosidase
MKATDKKWWKEAVVYQIYPRSFMDNNGDGIGDLRGITDRLDYLKDLGVDVLWLSPVYDSPNDDNGYDIRDYRAIMKEFGTMADFDELLAEAHQRGLKILMDLVVNHSSDEHVWFRESRKSRNNPFRDYYIWREGTGGSPPNNWASWFYGSAWEYDPPTDMYYLHIFSRKQADLNWENPKVRDEVYDMMKFWLDKGVDGFRMDVINLISKTPEYADGEVTGQYGSYGEPAPFCCNGPRVHEFLQEMNRRVLSKYDIMTVGETPEVTVEEAKRYTNTGGSELNMVFHFQHVKTEHGKYGRYTRRRFRLADIKRIMSAWQDGLYGAGWNSLYWENHDQSRSVSRFGNDSTPLLREKSAKMLACCLHMMQGTPFIYQGQELGMTNARFDSIADYRDIEAHNAYKTLVEQERVYTHTEMMDCINRMGRDNARFPFQWNSGPHAGFSASEPWIRVNPNYTAINAASQMADENSVFHFYKKLIALRKKHAIIVYGKYRLLESPEDLWVYVRELEDRALLVINSFSETEQYYAIPAEMAEKERELLIGNYPAEDTGNGINLRPYECRVYLL